MSDPTASPSLGKTALRGVPIELRVSVGHARPTLAELLTLERDTVLPLDKRIDEAVEVMVGDRIVARGELVELDGDQAGQLAVRLTDVVDPGDAV